MVIIVCFMYLFVSINTAICLNYTPLIVWGDPASRTMYLAVKIVLSSNHTNNHYFFQLSGMPFLLVDLICTLYPKLEYLYCTCGFYSSMFKAGRPLLLSSFLYLQWGSISTFFFFLSCFPCYLCLHLGDCFFLSVVTNVRMNN